MSAVYFVLAHLCITSTIPYYISPNLLDWHQAEDFCAQHCNSNLASIHSEAQNNELIALIQNIASDPMINIPSTIDTYIGLIDSNGNGNWAWSDGSSFDYGNDLSGGKGPWDTSNPNSNSNPICVQIEGNDKWNDVECNDAFTPVIFACNSCDGVLTKTAMEETRDNYEDNKVRCANKFGTELLSFHSQSDWDEATRLCRLINEQSSIGLGPRGADLEDDCHIGLYLRSNGQITFDDGSTFYWPGDFGYPWDDTLPTQSDPCTRIKWDANPVYSLSKAWCSDNQWALCNMPSEICYQSRWTAVSGTGWSFNKPPCQVSNSYASNQNALIMLEDRRWNNNGQNIVFEMLYTMNAVNPSQSNTEPSTAGIVWHVDNSCANYYYFGISVYDDTVFIAQVKHGVVNVIHSQSLSFSYSTGTYYSLKVAVSASNRFSIYANSALLISNAAGSDDFSALDTTNGYIGIKNMRSSVIVKSLFVSGEPMIETTNDAATWFDACAVPTEVPTDDPTVSPTTERPSNNPTKNPFASGQVNERSTEQTLLNEENRKDVSTRNNDVWFIVMGSIVAFVCFMCLVFVIYWKWCKSYRANKARKDTANLAASNKEKQTAEDDVSMTAKTTLSWALSQSEPKLPKSVSNEESLFDAEELYINNDAEMETNRTTKGTPGVVENNEHFGKCNDCGTFSKGKVYEGDGTIYCTECWEYYYTPQDRTEQNITNGTMTGTAGEKANVLFQAEKQGQETISHAMIQNGTMTGTGEKANDETLIDSNTQSLDQINIIVSTKMFIG
eukprot:18718_1